LEKPTQKEHHVGTIVICKNLTLALSAAQSWATDWISFPAEHQNADMVVALQGFTAANFSVQGQSSYDTETTLSAGAAATPTVVGNVVILITSNLGPMFRVLFTGTGSTVATISIYLTPKSN
jgi:hypothetical protein